LVDAHLLANLFVGAQYPEQTGGVTLRNVIKLVDDLNNPLNRVMCGDQLSDFSAGN